MSRELSKFIWYYVQNNQQVGPVEELEIIDLIRKKVINENTLVWNKEMIDWERAGKIDHFENLFVKPPPISLPPEVPSANTNLFINSQTNPKGRPWVRYLAKIIDISIFTFIINYLTQIFYPRINELNDVMYVVVTILLWSLIEPLILVVFGNTIGRAILKTKIKRVDGKKIDLYIAYKRSILLYSRGMGLGIPFISVVFQYLSFQELLRQGDNVWDTSNRLTTTHKKIGVFRIVFSVITVLMLFSSGYINYDNRLNIDLSSEELILYEEAYQDGLRAVQEGYIYDDYYGNIEDRDEKIYKDGYYSGYISAGGGSTFEYIILMLFNKHLYSTVLTIIAIWILITFILLKKNK